MTGSEGRDVRHGDTGASLPLELPHRLMVEPGSILIERYSYTRHGGGTGTQWIVHRIEDNGDLTNFIVCETRREAAEFVGRGLR